jgi:uncharacterized protein YqjF (DUF2071 family)
MSRAFLTAEWRHLVMLNYAVEPALLRPFVPSGTELDSWQGTTFVSLVGFLFADTRVLGVPIPWHRTFEEVNLRFYVRRSVAGEVRRAVTFIREVVPRSMIARVARLAYNEPYQVLPMRHQFGALSADGVPRTVEYEWRLSSGWAGMSVQSTGAGRVAEAGSLEEFITEHYWGYTRQRDGSTVEYQVAHPRWRVWPVLAPRVTGDMAALYGKDFATLLSSPPTSAFLADGSAVTVYAPSHLP